MSDERSDAAKGVAGVNLELIAPDLGPLGLRRYPQSRYPRRPESFVLPISHKESIQLIIPSPMTQFEWDLMLEGLALLRQGVVEPTRTLDLGAMARRWGAGVVQPLPPANELLTGNR